MLQKPTELGQGLGKGTTPLCRGLCSLFLSQPTFCSASAVPGLPGDRLEFVGDTWSVCRGQDGPQAGRALCGATRLSFVSALLLLSPPLLSPCSLLYTPLPCHTGPSVPARNRTRGLPWCGDGGSALGEEKLWPGWLQPSAMKRCSELPGAGGALRCRLLKNGLA